MNQVNKLKQLSELSYFNRTTLQHLYENISTKSLYENIQRWIDKGYLIQLKKGLYVTKEYLNKTDNKEAYKEFIANKLKFPSYLSLEYVLQKYSIISESTFVYTSISQKTKQTYENKLGVFSYRNIKDELFTGFNITQKGIYKIQEATKAKALFDYMYLKLLNTETFTKELLLSFRLNLDELTKDELQEFDKYCKLTQIQKFQELPKLLKQTYDFS